MKNLYLILVLIFMFSCAMDNNRSGDLTIYSPTGLINKYPSVVGASGEPISTPDENNYRINYFVEMDKNIIFTKTTKPGEKVNLSIPSNTFINLHIGVYYAENGSTNDEMYNSYLTSYKVDNLYVLPGESIKLDVELDLNKKTPFVSQTDYLMSDINGIITQDSKNYILFVNRPYNNFYQGNIIGYGNNSANVPYFKNSFNVVYDGLTFGGASSIFLSTDNKIISFFSDNNTVSYANQYFSVDDFIPGMTTATDTIYTHEFAKVIPKIDSLKSLTFFMGGKNITYYFALYDAGYITFTWDDESTLFSEASNIDLSNFMFLLNGLKLVTDLKIDEQNRENFYFLSKIGTFYINKSLVNTINVGGQFPFAKLLKVIIIPSDGNNKKIIAATNLEDFGNFLYLGSEDGVYKIDKTTSAWNNFVNADGSALFPKEEVKKMSSFGDDEFIIYMKKLNVKGVNYLVVSTPRRLLFINNNTGKISEFNVFDGIPFVPKKRFNAGRTVNESIFKKQFSYSIKDVVYFDEQIWLATEFGLARMNISYLK